jgi:hypothetical protein
MDPSFWPWNALISAKSSSPIKAIFPETLAKIERELNPM